MERRLLPAAALMAAALLSALSLSGYAWVLIEDEDTQSGIYSRAYAYVRGFVVEESPFNCKLTNVYHDWEPKDVNEIGVNAVIIVSKGTSSDSTDAWTITYVFVDPDGDGVYHLDAKATAHISVDNCMV